MVGLPVPVLDKNDVARSRFQAVRSAGSDSWKTTPRPVDE